MARRWSLKDANRWYSSLPWLVGSNYVPRSAVNQLEMWQEETFDLKTIAQELAWASDIGMNSMRVFLHDLLWMLEPKAFLKRIDQFLRLADKNGIKTMLVFFDSVWHPFPHAGKQREPEPGVHNSGWVQSPGIMVLQDYEKFEQLRSYISGVISHFADDPRIIAWDLWNEPDNGNGNSYGPRDLGLRKCEIACDLLPRVFDWARSAKPTQPLTCGLWLGDWGSEETLKPHEKLQIELSDVISFHCYGSAEDAKRRVLQLQRYKRPLLCTEYMSRGSGSTFETVLPIFKEHNVAAYNWGLVAGRTQTQYPWDSWQKSYATEPSPWFHEIFHPDGRAYSQAEVALIQSLTDRPKFETSARRSRRPNRSAS